jgi:para-aminobenzoate synthetase component I
LILRTFRSFPVKDITYFKSQMLDWLSRFSICCFLDNQQYNLPGHSQECIAAAGSVSSARSRDHCLENTGRFIEGQRDWIFGHLGYDLKNETEELSSLHPDHIGFPDAFFFVPDYVLIIEGPDIRIGSLLQDHDKVFQDILDSRPKPLKQTRCIIKERIDKDEYVEIIRNLQQHILRGDCYEINFCQEYYAEEALIDPLQTFRELSAISPNPFSAFYRLDKRYLLCASPERYLKKTGLHLISQPIKGTAPRNTRDSVADDQLGEFLFHSAKERSENVMVVDLVRNDLSRVCVEGSVKVDELFGVYAFPQVYQMISTVSGILRSGISFEEIIRASFPMGSMTGAPKKKVMELIERYEKTKRGIFSGAVGYISPEKDFDFNVVIRSIMYNAEDKYLSFLTGSGITFNSDPEKEYGECQLKAVAIKKVLNAG